MRSVGFTAGTVLVLALAANAQPPAIPGAPVAPAAAPADPKLDDHLAGWQERMTKASNSTNSTTRTCASWARCCNKRKKSKIYCT